MASPGLERTAKEQEARVIISPDDTGDADSPAYECESYREQLPDVQLMREVAGGTKTMRAQKEKYLPKHPMESDTKYAIRIGIALAGGTLARTVSGLVGMVFRRDPVLSDDMDPGLREAADDIDMKGHALPTFLDYASADSLLDGHVWIHVEAPRSGAAGTRAEERALELRPYWIKVLKADAINWRYEMRAGKPVLTLFAYREGGTRPKGRFGEEQLRRIRVLFETTGEDGAPEVRGELWEWEPGSKDEKSRWRRIEDYRIAADRVPVVFLPSKRTGPFESEPPLRDLAYEQAEHYRVRSERQKALTFTAVSVPYHFAKDALDAEGNAKVTWGSDGMLLSNDPEAKAGVVEAQGHGLTAMKEELADISARMATLGLQMLVRPSGPQARGEQITATSDIMRRSESDASLVLFADAIESAANEALELQASYRSKRPTPGKVTVNRDFHLQLLSPQHVQVLHEMVATDDLSLETLWARLKEGEVLPEDFDPEEEKRLIQAQIARRMQNAPELVGPDVDGGEDEPVDEPRDVA